MTIKLLAALGLLLVAVISGDRVVRRHSGTHGEEDKTTRDKVASQNPDPETPEEPKSWPYFSRT